MQCFGFSHMPAGADNNIKFISSYNNIKFISSYNNIKFISLVSCSCQEAEEEEEVLFFEFLE